MRAGDHGFGVEHALGLVEPARGQPQPHRRAVGLLHMVEGVAQQNGEFIGMGGLEARQPIGFWRVVARSAAGGRPRVRRRRRPSSSTRTG